MRLRCLLLLVLSTLMTPVWAQDSPALDRFRLAVGGFSGDSSSTFMARVKTPAGTVHRRANLEDEVGLPRHQTIGRVHAEGLFLDQVGWAFDYYSTRRDRQSGPAFGVPLKGRSVMAGPDALVRLRIDLGSASYRYWWGQQNDVVGLGLGLAYYHLDFRIQGATDGIHYAHGNTAPMISLGYRHQFDRHWRFYTDFAGIAKNTGSSQGHIYKGAVGVQYQSDGHFGAGVEYLVAHHDIQESVNIPGGRYTGEIIFNVHGPGAYVSWRW